MPEENLHQEPLSVMRYATLMFRSMAGNLFSEFHSSELTQELSRSLFPPFLIDIDPDLPHCRAVTACHCQLLSLGLKPLFPVLHALLF